MLTDILGSWYEFQANTPTTEADVQEQSLWLNNNVTMAKKTLCWRPWLCAGIVKVNDLLHPDLPRFMSHEELALRYNINVSFLQVLQIRSCLPFSWRHLLVGSAGPVIPMKPQILLTDSSKLDISNIKSRRIYSSIIVRKKQEVSSHRKWDLEFPPPQNMLDTDLWESKHRSPFRFTRETKLQSFQFKLLHRILPCRKYLRTIRITEDDKCPSCGEVDTLSHFFFHCLQVQTFWTMLCNWFSDQADIPLSNVNANEFMLGIPKENPQARILNFIVLTCKFYIFRQRLYYNSRFELVAFLRELRTKLKVEKYICSLEGKANRFNMWQSILSALG